MRPWLRWCAGSWQRTIRSASTFSGPLPRGDAGPDSDYDIMVVVPNDAPPELRRSRVAYTALWGTGVASDVLVWTASQFDSRTHLAATLPATVLREVKLLHAA